MSSVDNKNNITHITHINMNDTPNPTRHRHRRQLCTYLEGAHQYMRGRAPVSAPCLCAERDRPRTGDAPSVAPAQNRARSVLSAEKIQKKKKKTERRTRFRCARPYSSYVSFSVLCMYRACCRRYCIGSCSPRRWGEGWKRRQRGRESCCPRGRRARLHPRLHAYQTGRTCRYTCITHACKDEHAGTVRHIHIWDMHGALCVCVSPPGKERPQQGLALHGLSCQSRYYSRQNKHVDRHHASYIYMGYILF